jgi:hypothetical protein
MAGTAASGTRQRRRQIATFFFLAFPSSFGPRKGMSIRWLIRTDQYLNCSFIQYIQINVYTRVHPPAVASTASKPFATTTYASVSRLYTHACSVIYLEFSFCCDRLSCCASRSKWGFCTHGKPINKCMIGCNTWDVSWVPCCTIWCSTPHDVTCHMGLFARRVKHYSSNSNSCLFDRQKHPSWKIM